MTHQQDEKKTKRKAVYGLQLVGWCVVLLHFAFCILHLAKETWHNFDKPRLQCKMIPGQHCCRRTNCKEKQHKNQEPRTHPLQYGCNGNSLLTSPDFANRSPQAPARCIFQPDSTVKCTLSKLYVAPCPILHPMSTCISRT